MNAPKGWKLVPVEPTDKMLDAAMNAPAYGHPETAVPSMSSIYRSMLRAAPEAPE